MHRVAFILAGCFFILFLFVLFFVEIDVVLRFLVIILGEVDIGSDDTVRSQIVLFVILLIVIVRRERDLFLFIVLIVKARMPRSGLRAVVTMAGLGFVFEDLLNRIIMLHAGISPKPCDAF